MVNRLLTTIHIHLGKENLTKVTKVLTDTQSIRLKGRSFLALALSPELPFDNWLVRLDNLASRSAGFFLQRPIVLDVAGVEIDRPQLLGLISRLAKRNVRIMGIEGACPSLIGPDMPPAMTGGLPACDLEASEAKTKDAEQIQPADPEHPCEPEIGGAAPPIMVTEPVRSGQSLRSDGDISIVGSVASGAEVVAGGSIHIYGTLRGRALAGSAGDASARIFCRKLEAELVAIAGLYMTSEHLEPGLSGRAVQLRLENDLILAETLG